MMSCNRKNLSNLTHPLACTIRLRPTSFLSNPLTPWLPLGSGQCIGNILTFSPREFHMIRIWQIYRLLPGKQGAGWRARRQYSERNVTHVLHVLEAAHVEVLLLLVILIILVHPLHQTGVDDSDNVRWSLGFTLCFAETEMFSVQKWPIGMDGQFHKLFKESVAIRVLHWALEPQCKGIELYIFTSYIKDTHTDVVQFKTS